MVRMYTEAYTLEELKEINAFYSSKVGKKTLELMPRLVARSGQIAAAKVEDNLDELRTMIKAENFEGFKEDNEVMKRWPLRAWTDSAYRLFL